MTKRKRVGGSRAHPRLTATLERAEQEFALDWEASRGDGNQSLKGGLREQSLRTFLEEYLPERFATTTGVAIDSFGAETGQLDVIVYDRMLNSPLIRERGARSAVIPAEALLAAVEVKSTLTSEELAKCVDAAARIRRLRPAKKEFSLRRRGGIAAGDGKYRCSYSVFAYDTDLVEGRWPNNEWERLLKATDSVVDGAGIDLILILSRGYIDPVAHRARTGGLQGRPLLLAWFLRLTNFLTRESERRRAVDWELYSGRGRPALHELFEGGAET